MPKPIFSLLALLALLALSCSGDGDSPEPVQKYAWCVFNSDRTCVAGPFTAEACKGQPGNSCPAGYDGGSSSSTGTPSSSSRLASSSSATPSSSSHPASSSSATPSSSSLPSSSSFECDIAGYRTVDIGEQTWMAENLNCDVDGSICYDNDPTNCDKYGRLYTWTTIMAFSGLSCSHIIDCLPQIRTKHRGICPMGWHLPSDAEWNALMKFVNPSCSDNSNCAIAGTKLKATSGWDWNNWQDISGNGTDDYGFSALPGGYGYSYGGSNGGFSNDGHLGIVGYWWSTGVNYNNNYTYFWYMGYDQKSTSYNSYPNGYYFFSVRCVKD